MSVSDEILKRMADSYRRMRNTVRFLLGNLHGFDPARDTVRPDSMVALDQWALARARELQAQVIDAYRKYAFHLIYQKVHNFCVVDLGGFYLDILKDRLYTTPAHSEARRSAQTAMYHIAEAMVRWLAPILSFTADEIWRFMPGERSASVFLETWHAMPEPPQPDVNWPALMALRADVTRELEKLREAGTIGAPLDAEVDVYVSAGNGARFAQLGEELRFVFITSDARVHEVQRAPADAVPATSAGEGVWISVRPAQAMKCVRCWHHRPDVGSAPAHPELCGRCVVNVSGEGEQRRFA
jgi:isoleucyl-tRNA synthetase